MDEYQSKEILRKVIAVSLGGKVERCHGIPHQGSYSNAAHQWRVAILMYYLFPSDFPRLAIYCLTHDVPEGWIGDIPAPTMRYVPGLAESLIEHETKICHSLSLPSESADLTKFDYEKLKACDKLEFWLWCREQVMVGNKYAEDGMHEIERYLNETYLPSPAQDFYEKVKWESVLPRQGSVMRKLVENEDGS